MYVDGKKVSYNDLEFKVYEDINFNGDDKLLVYDPENMLDIKGIRLKGLDEVSKYEKTTLCVGPYALDNQSIKHNDVVGLWINEGGRVVVLEQTPGYFTENIFNSNISSARVCQPRWSRWAMNLVKHADRVDITKKEHYLFDGIKKDDMFWWNIDTYLADSYLYCNEENEDVTVISRVGNGLSQGELMPVEYEYKSSGYSIASIEKKMGKGSILLTSLLIGTKYKSEPVAKQILKNILK